MQIVQSKKIEMISLRKFVIAFSLIGCLLLTSCGSTTTSRFDEAQQESTSSATTVVNNAQSGSTFNRYFPDSSNEYERVYTQEKKGFAQAKLKREGKEIAILSISDVANTSAVNKFQDSSSKIKGYPAIEQGKTATAILVNDRYQVKIRSKDSSFTQSDRQKWLGKFNLRGLTKLN